MRAYVSPPVPRPTVVDAVRFLASCCDGARRDDGVGFAREHARVGHLLAEMPIEEWQLVHVRAARWLVRVYRRQLADAGYDVAELLDGRLGRVRTALTEVGWQLDPFGLFAWRWWDGVRWTQHVWPPIRASDHRCE